MDDVSTTDGVRDRAAAARQAAVEHRRAVRETVAVAHATRADLRIDRAAPVQLAELVRALHADRTERAVLDRVVALAGRAVVTADHASITRPGPVTAAATGDLPRQLDALQYAAGTGPCLEALATGPTRLSGDLAAERRWGTFAAGAARAGVRSVLSLRLDDGGQPVGSLNLYAAAPCAFGPRAAAAGSAYAVHAALALGRAAERETLAQLQEAVASNRVIGTAIGMLMQAGRLTESEAFELLRTRSQHTNRKLRDLAAELVRTGVTA